MAKTKSASKNKKSKTSKLKQLSIKETLFKEKSKPKPQSSASAKLKKRKGKKESQDDNNNTGREIQEENNNSDGQEPENVTSAPKSGSLMEELTTPSTVVNVPIKSDANLKFKCKNCDKRFPNRYYQRKHMLIVHEDQVFECRICAFTSTVPETLKTHIVKMHVTKKERSENFSTEHLNQELEKLIGCKEPRKIVTEDGVTLDRDLKMKMRYACALCNRIYMSKYGLERHVRCHTLEKPFECDVCDFTSSYKEHMMRHMKSVHLIVHSNVPKPKYVPPKKDENKPHKRRKILCQRYECAVCGIKAALKSELFDHITQKHPNAHIESMENKDGSKVHLIVSAPKPIKRKSKLFSVQCEHCSLIFHDKWKYKVHLRSHTGVKPFGCSLCEFKATYKMTVRDHIHRKHEGQNGNIVIKTVGIDGNLDQIIVPCPESSFNCESCELVFKNKYALKRHKADEHKDEQPFRCMTCDHKCTTRAYMIIHCMNEHPNDNIDEIIMHKNKPIKVGSVRVPFCNICSKYFPYQSQLNNHLRLHTGERTFQCEKCEYKTNMRKALLKHTLKAHTDRANKKGKRSKRKQIESDPESEEDEPIEEGNDDVQQTEEEDVDHIESEPEVNAK